MINGANPGLTEKCMMLYSVRYVNFEKNTQAITITEEVVLWSMLARGCWQRISANLLSAPMLPAPCFLVPTRSEFLTGAVSTAIIDDVMVYLLSKINVEYIIKHVKRDERPELPEEALREAVVNALAHRDYRSTANVQVYIFKDRVEIVSPGG